MVLLLQIYSVILVPHKYVFVRMQVDALRIIVHNADMARFIECQKKGIYLIYVGIPIDICTGPFAYIIDLSSDIVLFVQ